MQGADERPLLVLDRKTKGRVALLLSDHAWLWARGYEGGGPHTDLLRRLSHWLMKEPDLEEERLLASAKGLKLTVERRSMEEETVGRVQVSAPGGESSEITLEKAGAGRVARHRRCGGARPLQAGDPLVAGPAHRRRPRRRRGRARDERGDGHRREAAPARRARPAAACSGRAARGCWPASASGVDLPRISMLANARVLAGSGWLGLKDREAFVTRGVKLIPMFTGFLALAALLALLAATWWREGR